MIASQRRWTFCSEEQPHSRFHSVQRKLQCPCSVQRSMWPQGLNSDRNLQDRPPPFHAANTSHREMLLERTRIELKKKICNSSRSAGAPQESSFAIAHICNTGTDASIDELLVTNKISSQDVRRRLAVRTQVRRLNVSAHITQALKL